MTPPIIARVRRFLTEDFVAVAACHWAVGAYAEATWWEDRARYVDAATDAVVESAAGELAQLCERGIALAPVAGHA